jgi:hypothetical protein
MRDITCSQCGEPWNGYALRHDVPEWPDSPDDAYERFMSGDGCPTCDWGEKGGDVSRSRTTDSEQLQAEHLRDIMNNSDEDPLKYI